MHKLCPDQAEVWRQKLIKAAKLHTEDDLSYRRVTEIREIGRPEGHAYDDVFAWPEYQANASLL